MRGLVQSRSSQMPLSGQRNLPWKSQTNYGHTRGLTTCEEGRLAIPTEAAASVLLCCSRNVEKHHCGSISEQNFEFKYWPERTKVAKFSGATYLKTPKVWSISRSC